MKEKKRYIFQSMGMGKSPKVYYSETILQTASDLKFV